MSNLTRYTQKLFASLAGSNQLSEYGSFIASPPGNLYSGSTISPAIVQQLTQFLDGQYAAVGGSYSPTIQDHNSLFYLAFYQLAYILLKGMAEWDSGTTYFIGSMVQDGTGVIYISNTNNNLNNALSNATNWRKLINPPIFTNFENGGLSGNYTTSSTIAPLYLRIKIMGAGGGGGGSGSSAPAPGNGTSGGDSTFGSITAGGGDGGTPSGAHGGAGGIYSVTSPAVSIFFTQGGYGGSGSFAVINTSDIFSLYGGAGGGGPLGVTPAYSSPTIPISGNQGQGAGGAGAGGTVSTAIAAGTFNTGAGGGAGAYVDAYIPNPGKNTTFAYSVGVRGTGGTGGTDGRKGGDGSDGVIIIEEYYQ